MTSMYNIEAIINTLGETGTKKTRNLLDKSLRGEEGIVFLGELLHELLVFVQSNALSVRSSYCSNR